MTVVPAAVTISAVVEHLGLDPNAAAGALAVTAAAALFLWLIFFAFDDVEPHDDDHTGYGW